MTDEETYSAYKMTQVIDAEQDAARRAMILLRKWDIDMTPHELRKESYKEFTDFWRKEYFID